MGKRDVSTKPSTSDDGLNDESFAGRQFITALARGLDVLGAFRAGDPPLSNQELARRSGLPRPTISRITHTLTELGYLSYHEGFGCYELGGAMLTLGHVAKENFEALEAARPILNELAIFSNANVGVGTRDRLNMHYIAVAKAPSGIGLRFEPGSKVPILETAMGRAYLAGIDSEEREALSSRLKQRHADEPSVVETVIRSALAQFDADRVCTSIGNWHEDVHGIATAIPSTPFSDILVLNCGAPASLLPAERMTAEVGPKLVETAARLGKILAEFENSKRAG